LFVLRISSGLRLLHDLLPRRIIAPGEAVLDAGEEGGIGGEEGRRGVHSEVVRRRGEAFTLNVLRARL
jgi:hypothetical protein